MVPFMRPLLRDPARRENGVCKRPQISAHHFFPLLVVKVPVPTILRDVGTYIRDLQSRIYEDALKGPVRTAACFLFHLNAS